MPRALGVRANRFGRFVRKRRTELGLMQREVADAIGSGAEFIGLIEAGHRQPNFDRLPDMAKVLQVQTFALARLAFTDVYPRLTVALFRNKAGLVKRGRIDHEITDVAAKLQALPDTLRQPMITMINHMYAENMNQQEELFMKLA